VAKDSGTAAVDSVRRKFADRNRISHVEAAGALHIHEKTIGALHEALELVLLLLVRGGGVKKTLHL
jgi:hypothetical protein